AVAEDRVAVQRLDDREDDLHDEQDFDEDEAEDGHVVRPLLGERESDGEEADGEADADLDPGVPVDHRSLPGSVGKFVITLVLPFSTLTSPSSLPSGARAAAMAASGWSTATRLPLARSAACSAVSRMVGKSRPATTPGSSSSP